MSRVNVNERGAAAVEFALVLPILILIVFGIIEFGRAYNAKITLTHAAREGGRAAAIGKSDDEVTEIVEGAATPYSDSVAVTISACVPGDPVTVTVSYPFSFVTPIFGSPLTLTSKGTMRCGG